jgi:hypothetical protein
VSAGTAASPCLYAWLSALHMALLPSHAFKVLPETTSMAGESHRDCTRSGPRSPQQDTQPTRHGPDKTVCNLKLPLSPHSTQKQLAQLHSSCTTAHAACFSCTCRPQMQGHTQVCHSTPSTAARMPQAGRHKCAVAAGLGCCASDRSSAPTLHIARDTTCTGTSTRQAPSTAAAAYTCIAGTAVSAPPSSYL